jgi:hypothetical protein
MPIFLTKYHSGDQVDKNEMGGACSIYGGRRELQEEFWSEDLRERKHLEDTGVDGRIILKRS